MVIYVNKSLTMWMGILLHICKGNAHILDKLPYCFMVSKQLNMQTYMLHLQNKSQIQFLSDILLVNKRLLRNIPWIPRRSTILVNLFVLHTHQ